VYVYGLTHCATALPAPHLLEEKPWAFDPSFCFEGATILPSEQQLKQRITVSDFILAFGETSPLGGGLEEAGAAVPRLCTNFTALLPAVRRDD